MSILAMPTGQVFTAPNMRVPEQGTQCASFRLDFGADARLDGSLEQIFTGGDFDFVQSVWIDNSSNFSTFTLTFPGVAPSGFSIQAQPLTQGFYPISMPVGDARFFALAPNGAKIPIVFYNVPMPYLQWGPVPGVLVVPALVSKPLDFIPSAAGGNQQLVAGVGGQTIKLYRAMFTFGNPVTAGFQSGVTNLGDFDFTAGGSMLLPPSGVPWFTTALGQDLNLNTSAAVNVRGVIGYVQS